MTDHCSGCGQPEPDWPAGWLTLDNGDRYCPPAARTCTCCTANGDSTPATTPPT